MASFCTLNPSADHSTDWNKPYTGKHSIIGGLSSSSISRDQNGLIPDSEIPGIIQSLTTKGIIPRPPANTTNPKDLDTFLEADTAFINGTKDEYCYYNERYVWSINQLFGSLVGPAGKAYTTVTTAQQATINMYLKSSVQLNQTLNDITQIVKGVVNSRVKDIKSLSGSINQLNAELDNTEKSLAKQKDILSKGKDTTVLYKEMEKYSKQKNRYNGNMLMLYSFLNITALGLLFYVYRSASE